MAHRLAEALHWCDSGGRAVFLDLRSDRYFCLSKAANDAFLRLVAEKGIDEDRERLQALVKRGVLINTDRGTNIRPAPSIEPPTSDVPPSRSGFFYLVRAILAERAVAKDLRGKSFDTVLTETREMRPRAARHSTDSDLLLPKLGQAWGVLALFTRSHDRCLVRALAAYRLCRTLGVQTKLVFGVIAHPFAAHCWVQAGCQVVVGGHEQARLYTPIMVVE